MDWDQMEAEWERMKDLALARWAKFTNEDLTQIGGKRDRMIAKLQERYDISKDEAFRRAEEWLHQRRSGQRSASDAGSHR